MPLIFIRSIRLKGKKSLRTRRDALAPGADAPAQPPKKQPRHEPSPPPARSLFASCFSQMDAFTSPPGTLIWVTARLILRQDLVSRMEQVAPLSNLS